MFTRRHAVLSLCAAVAGCASASSVVDPPTPDDALDPFYEPLCAHGDWWWHERWGWVWTPHSGPGWRPYSVGSWVWTDDGWLWASSEPFGWATFHYGRWTWLSDVGWVWVPGRVWGPAWVVWRQAPGYVGWGPIGPEVVWVPGHGFVDDVDVGIVGWGWIFVSDGYLIAPNISVVCLPAPRNVVVLPTSRVLHRPEARGERVHNRGIDVVVVEKATGVRMVPRRIIEDDHDDFSSARESREGEVVVRRPRALPRPRANERDLYDGRTRSSRDVEERRLRAPADEDVDRHYNQVRERLIETHDLERQQRTPGPGDVSVRQRQELEELERERDDEKKASNKRKASTKKTPRKVVKIPR